MVPGTRQVPTRVKLVLVYTYNMVYGSEYRLNHVNTYADNAEGYFNIFTQKCIFLRIYIGTIIEKKTFMSLAEVFVTGLLN